MGGDERAGARTGQPDNELAGSLGSGFSGVGGYLIRGLLSAGALACAGLVLATLGEVGAPLPDRGLARPATAAIAAPAALPSVPDPVGIVTMPQQPAAPAAGSAGPAAGAQPGPVASQPGPQPAQQPFDPNLPGSATQVTFSAWADRMAALTGISPRAMRAYATAHTAMAATEPKCQLTWVTLAGIAKVESNHGTIGARTILPDGRVSSPIIGVPLNGAPGVRSVAATPAGYYFDHDPQWDHAIGPFQFLPSTWAAWQSDGNGDGKADPQNIDDAAIAAARYLCADNRNLASSDGWLQAIMSYNNSVDYVQQVYTASQDYARSVQGHG